MSGAYYNEFDPKAAAWLRELIRRKLIAPGDVDERSIEDIAPYEIAKYTQCHFFAGIGVWSYALRLAGWADTRPVWTGSCPCQPFSQAGKSAGTSDERHLWPAWEHLIRERRPPVLFGEQVASKAADSWADLVQDDLEALGYAFGAIPFPAASVGAPHIRDRLYWCAVADADGRYARAEGLQRGGEHRQQPQDGSASDGLADHDDAGCVEHTQRHSESERGQQSRPLRDDAGGRGLVGDSGGGGGSGRDTREVLGTQSRAERCLRGELDFTQSASGDGELGVAASGGRARSGDQPTHLVSLQTSPWANAELIWCRDGKWRPVESGTFPLAHGAPARVGRLRGYGNAVVSEAARVWIETCIEAGV